MPRKAAVRVINTVLRKHEGDDANRTDDPTVVKIAKKKKLAPRAGFGPATN